jgi:uncharacterized protein YndB with AHSA1/START domain
MRLTPTGRLHATDEGRDLVLVREFNAPIEDVWDSVTQPERTGRWFGTWSGEARPGTTVDMVLTAEEGNPTAKMTVTACTPPQHVAVAMIDESGTWHLEAKLRETDGVTTLELIHHLPDDADPGEVGPGWEFYLDRLVASRDGTEMPVFDDYYPSMASYYTDQLK